jgi:hypothetical protein
VDGGALHFHPLDELTTLDVEEVLATIEPLVTRRLRRRGLTGDTEDATGGWADDAPVFAELAAASIDGRAALGARRGARPARIGRLPTWNLTSAAPVRVYRFGPMPSSSQRLLSMLRTLKVTCWPSGVRVIRSDGLRIAAGSWLGWSVAIIRSGPPATGREKSTPPRLASLAQYNSVPLREKPQTLACRAKSRSVFPSGDTRRQPAWAL